MADQQRFDQTFTITTTQNGRMVIRVLDAINIDDVFVHLVNRELYRLVTGIDPGADVPKQWVDDLVTTNYTAGG